MKSKYNFKKMTQQLHMKGKISAQELDKIKNDFNSSVALKKELQNFLNSGYMKELIRHIRTQSTCYGKES